MGVLGVSVWGLLLESFFPDNAGDLPFVRDRDAFRFRAG